MLGRDLLIAVGGRAIAAQRSCSPNIQQDTIEVCSPVSGPWKEFIPGTIGWDVSCEGLIYAPEYADELMDVLTRRQKVRLSYYDPELRIVRSGYAIPTGLQQGASINSLATYSLSFQGSGPLGKVEYSEWMEPEFVDWVSDRAYDWKSKESHPVVEVDVQDLSVCKIVVEKTCRMLIDTGQMQMYLYKCGGEIIDRLAAKDNIWLYMHEVAHPQTDDIGHLGEPLLLAPGTYYITKNGDYEHGDIRYKTLSLPID